MRSAARAASAWCAICSKLSWREGEAAQLDIASDRSTKGSHLKPIGQEYRGWLSWAIPLFLRWQFSERILRAYFQNTMAVMVVGVTEGLAVYAGTRMVGIGGVRQNAIRKAHF